MVRAKQYETASTFVIVMQRKLWLLLSRHGVYMFIYVYILGLYTGYVYKYYEC